MASIVVEHALAVDLEHKDANYRCRRRSECSPRKLISPLGAYACNGHAEHGASKVHTVIARSRCLTRFFGRAPWVSAALSSAIAARSALLAHSDSERFCFIALRSVALRLEPAGQNAAAFTWLPGYKEKRENGLTRRNVICA